MADPGPLLKFVFAMFAVLSWLPSVVSLTPDAQFEMGVVQITLGIAAFAGSHMALKNGNPQGNINLILAVILGFSSGLTKLCAIGAKALHIPYHPWVLSVILLLGGLYMLSFIPLFAGGPMYVLAAHICVCAGFLCSALSDLCSIPVLKTISAWLLLLFAAGSLYQGIVMMYAQYGYKLPQGPIFHDKNTDRIKQMKNSGKFDA